jgi:hypothetical protein
MNAPTPSFELIFASMRSLWIQLFSVVLKRGREASPGILACAFFLLWPSSPADASQEMGLVNVVKSDPSTPGTVFAGAQRGLFKSTDAGATWNPTGLTQATVALAIAPVTSTIYAGTSSGLFKSTDGGTIWSTAGVSGQVCSVEIDPAAIPTTLYASLCSQIMKGIDLGEPGVNWSSVGPLEPIYSVAIAAGPPLILYAWDGVQVFSSIDGGVKWDIGGSTPVSAWSIDPMMPTTVYVNYYGWGCTNDFCFTTAGINKSIDRGASWVELAQVLYPDNWSSAQPYVSPVAIDPLASNILYAAWTVSCDPSDVYCAAYGIVEDRWISKSTDGGASWFRVSDLGAGALWFDPLTRTVLYATTYSGDVLQSTDGGVTWSAPGTTLTSLSLQPNSAPGGSTSTGTVTLSATGGAVVTLSSSNTAAATVPASVTVLSPSTTATFPVTTKAVTTSTTVTITATLGDNTQTATLTVNPPPQFILSLSTVGSGTITASPAPVSGTYAAGTVVSLTATPASGSQFGGWSGACSGTGACSVTMDAAKSVTATFTLKQYALTVSTAGNGSGTVSPSGGTYNHGTVVALTATPASGSQFGGWSGACSGTGACSVTMDAAKSVTATFAALPPPVVTLSSLTLQPTSVKGGNGNTSTGTVTLSGPAPTGGLSVTLSSSQPTIAAVPTNPSSVTVPAGARSATFTVSTSRPPSNNTKVTISATLGVTKEATLTVKR